jgi:hypothetical protein
VNRYPFLRIVGIILITTVGGFSAKAQASSSTQTVNLTFANVVEILFTGTGSTTGSNVTMPFTNLNDYTNGVESSDYQLRVRSNKDFNVTVKTNAANFTYSGTTSPAPVMSVSGRLLLKVTANSTGGNISSPFSGYTSLTSSNQNLITSGDRGGNQTFSVKYQGKPGFGYPAGDYNVNVIYTVTQQ